MLAKRIIPCLDVKNGRVVKGVNFKNLADVDDPVALAKFYNGESADELVFYDITASFENRPLFLDVLTRTAAEVFIPLTVGGSINSVEDFSRALNAGADKVSVNSGAVKDRTLIETAAKKFGSQCVVLSVDVKRTKNGYRVFINGGRVDTGLDAKQYIEYGVNAGAGEIVLNSMDADGVKGGFDIEMLNDLTANLSVPVIASGGAGSIEHFYELFTKTNADAGLAASIFHFKEVEIRALKTYLRNKGIEVRI